MTQTFHYFEAHKPVRLDRWNLIPFVLKPFEAVDIEAALVHALLQYRDPANPDFDDKADGGILGWDEVLQEWECLVTFVGDIVGPNPERLALVAQAAAKSLNVNVEVQR